MFNIQARALSCKDVFKEKQPDIIDTLIANNPGVDLSRNFNEGLLNPKDIPLSDIYTREELSRVTPSQLNLSPNQLKAALKRMQNNERLVVTPLGISLWTVEALRDWVYLGESQVLTNGDAAKRFVERVVREKNGVPGWSAYWVKQLRDSSNREGRVRKTVSEEMQSKPIEEIDAYRSNFKKLFFDTVSLIDKYSGIEASRENGFRFPWGVFSAPELFSSGEMPTHQEMRPEYAIEVTRVFTNLSLVENTLFFESGKVVKAVEGALSIDTMVILALYPQLMFNSSEFTTNPVEFRANEPVSLGQKISSQSIAIDAVPFMGQKIRFDVGIETRSRRFVAKDNTALSGKKVTHDVEEVFEKPETYVEILINSDVGIGFTETNIYQSVHALLLKSVAEVTEKTRQETINPESTFEVENESSTNESAWVRFKGLSLAEGHMVFLKLRELMGQKGPVNYQSYTAAYQ